MNANMETTNQNPQLSVTIRAKGKNFFDARKDKAIKSKVLKSFAVILDNYGYVIMAEVQSRNDKKFDIFSLVKVNMTTGEAEIEQNCKTLDECKAEFFRIKRKFNTL